MRTAKGLKGIRKFKAANTRNWHISINGAPTVFFPFTVTEVFNHFSSDQYELTWFGGNVLFITYTPKEIQP